LAEIQELLRKKEKANSDRLQLAKFEVVRSRFYQQQREFFGEDPVIELTVKNGTPNVVSRAYFTGTLASPDRSVPWVKDDFNYRIPGGLEPGETATWKLEAYTFGLWDQVKAPKDAILTVEVVQLDGVDGKPLLSIKEFSDEDAKRLSELQQKFPE
jgi:hypothetical protein